MRHSHTAHRDFPVNFEETTVEGVYVAASEGHADNRGRFARLFCEIEMSDNGLPFHIVQSSISLNSTAGTLRGLHYQSAAAPESKLVRCVRGAIWDIAVDLRPSSKSYMKWFGSELSDENLKALLIPAGCAHGFITLTDNAEVLYMMDQAYTPDSARGVRWNDEAFAIQWPQQPRVISERDATYPDYEPA